MFWYQIDAKLSLILVIWGLKKFTTWLNRNLTLENQSYMQLITPVLHL
jgi:hypothetical protein